MSQAQVDEVVMEVLGQTTPQIRIDHFICEVLGVYPYFGDINIDSIVMETLGKTNRGYSQIDSIVMEVIGQWSGF